MSSAEAVLEPPVPLQKPDPGPYKGLDYYREDDQTRFAGRQTDIFELISRIASGRVLVLYGRSGLGKTSLLLAGLFPALREQGYTPVYVRTLQHPLDDLKTAIRATYHVDQNAVLELKGLVEEAAKDGTVLLVLDQFEEFFIRFSNEPNLRCDFVTAVTEVIRDEEIDVRILFSLREDYLAALDDFQRALPHLFVNAYRLLPLTPMAARQAIVGPLKRDGIQYDEQLVSRLVDDLARFNFDSARLQIACTELYHTAKTRADEVARLDQTDSATRLTEVDLDELRKSSGDLEGVFRRYVQAAIDKIPKERHPLARSILDMLITRADTKFAISRSELLGLKLATEDEVDAVLDKLVVRKIIRQEPRGTEDWYELIHECLVPEIKRWLDENSEFANFRLARDLIGYYSLEGRFREQKALLLSAETVKGMVSPHKEWFRLTPLQVEFLLWSAIAAQVDDISYWMERLEQEGKERLLAELLDKEDPDLRAGAAIATRCCGGHDRELVAKCMTLALDETQPPQVRKAAGQTVALLSSDEELVCIKKQLGIFRRTPAHIRELLADLAERGRVRKLFGRRRARHARRWLRKRFIRHNDAVIRKAGNSGALRGLLAAVAWAFTSGVLYSVLYDWICNPFPAKLFVEKLYFYVGWPILPGILLGTLVGWRVMRLTVQAQDSPGKHLWSTVIRRSLVLRWIILPAAALLCLSVALAITEYSGLEFGNEQLEVLVILGVPIIAGWFLARGIRFLIAKAAAVASDCLSGSFGHRFLWTVIPNIALGVVFPAMVITSIVSLVPNDILEPRQASEPAVLFLCGAAAVSVVGGFLFFVVMATLGLFQPNETADKDGGSLAKRYRIRSCFAVGAFLLVPWFLYAYGMRTIPIRVDRRPLPADGILRAKLQRWPETNYLLLRGETNGALFHATLPSEVRVTLNRRDFGANAADSRDLVLFVPSADLDVSISNFTLTRRRRPTEMKLTPIPIQTAGSVPLTGEIVYFKCDLASETRTPSKQSITDPSPPRWRGELKGRFENYEHDLDNEVEISLNQYSILNSNRSIVVEDVSDPAGSYKSAWKESIYFIVEGGKVGVFPSDSQREGVRRSDISDSPLISKVSIDAYGEWSVNIAARALRGYERSASSDPVSIVVGARLRNSTAEILKSFYKAWESNPTNPENAIRLARALYLRGNNNKATPIARKAVELAPYDFQAWDLLAHIAFAAGRWKEADEAWTTVERLSPMFFESAQAECRGDRDRQREAKAKAAAALPGPR